MIHPSDVVDKLREKVRDVKCRNQLRKKYPFIKGFRKDRVHFKDIAFAEYVVAGMVLDTRDGSITQVRGNRKHPHLVTFESSSGRGFCADLRYLRQLLRENRLEEAILEAFCIINSYNPVGAVRRPPGSVVCFVCGEPIRDYSWDYSIDRSVASVPGVYYTNDVRYVAYHYTCAPRILSKD